MKLRDKKNKVVIIAFTLLVGVLGFGGSVRANVLIDYENSNLSSPSGGHFRYYQEGNEILTLDKTQGMAGTYQSLQVNSILTNFHIWWIQNDAQRDLIPEAYGCNRMSFYLKLPDNYPVTSLDYNFNVGTYTRDPQIPSDIQGEHYYHYLNIPGSKYPTRIILNQHPQHHTGSKIPPINNPETWNYYSGLTRFYLQALPYPDPPISLPFFSNVDEVKFYSTSEPENDETINSIACTYMGEGRFRINWHGSSQYDQDNCDDHIFEIRYSTSPITNSNYPSATIVPGGPFSLVPGSYNLWLVDFTIPIISGTVYFAVKDLNSTKSYVSKIDYFISETNDTTPPILSSGNPTGTLPSGTTSINISLTTDVQAICCYSNVSDTNYIDMEYNFTSTNSTNHSTPISSLENGQTYIYYIRCNSSNGYVNEDDFNITFSIDGHKADLNDDGVINMKELIAFIARWKANNGVSKAEVLDAREIWFTGGVY